jgi:hypothetical protein
MFKVEITSVVQRSKTVISRTADSILMVLRSSWHGLTAWFREHCSLRWFLFQSACLITIGALYRKWPTMPVGFAIGAAGVVAAGMTLRDGRWKAVEKFLWIVVITGLWAMDANNIFREQKTHDTEQKAVSNSLKVTQDKLDVAQGKLADTQSELSSAIKQLDVISRSQGKTLALTTENQKQLTGGDSYCYIDFTHFVDGPRLINGGKYPLHAVTINAKDLDEDKRLFDRIPQAQFHPEWDLKKDLTTRAEATIPMGDLGPYGNIPVPSIPILQGDYERTLDITFTGGVGYVFQHTCLKYVTNSRHLSAATKVWTREKQRKFEVDQNYPREANGDVGCFLSAK